MLPQDWVVGKPVAIFLISDYREKAQPHLGGAIPGPVVQGSIRKQAEQAMRNKPVSSISL